MFLGAAFAGKALSLLSPHPPFQTQPPAVSHTRWRPGLPEVTETWWVTCSCQPGGCYLFQMWNPLRG